MGVRSQEPQGPRPPSPPRLAEKTLRLFLPYGQRGEAALRELRSEFQAVSELRGRPARFWYAKEAFGLCVHFLIYRLREGLSFGAGSGGGSGLERVGHDVRYALRRIRKSPGFAFVALGTMALGIGATVSIFSVVDAVVLRPLPYDRPEELAVVWEHNVPRDNQRNVVNPGNYKAWRERTTTFADLAAVYMIQPQIMETAEGPLEVQARWMSANFFSLLGVDPYLGRLPASDEVLATPEIMLTYGLWMRTFGGDPAALGQNLSLSGNVGVVVGVLPDEFVIHGEGTDLFGAIEIRGDQTNTGRYLNIVGRLEQGRSLEQASDEMRAIAAGLEEEFPDFNAGWSAQVVPVQEQVVGDVQMALWFLLGVVGLLLLIACANVANLFLARATERQREMAVRTSLGAGRGRLVLQLMVESLVIATGGAILGLGLAHLGTGLIARSIPDAFAVPRVEAAGLDLRVLGFAATLTVLTGLLFGALPALQASRVAPASTLGSEGRSSSRRTLRTRGALVVLEVALSMTLLAGAGLLGRSFLRLVSVESGVTATESITARLTLFGPRYEGTERDAQFFTELSDRLHEVPGIQAAGGITFLPRTGLASATSFYADDRPVPPPGEWPVAEIRNVSGEYFAALGVSLLQGRTFDLSDRGDAPERVIVNRALADQFWPDGSAVGRAIRINWGELTPIEIVGVVEDVHHYGLGTAPTPMAYLPYHQKPYFPFQTLVLRSTLTPPAVVQALEDVVSEMDPALALSDVRTVDEIMYESVARPRMMAYLTGLFAAAAAVLAALGLYGVLAYTVAQQSREIGIRMALGAGGPRTIRRVLRDGLTLTGLGLVVGLFGAVVIGRLAEALLFGVEAMDPPSLLAAAAVLTTVTGAACLIPAVRATRVHPAEALRGE